MEGSVTLKVINFGSKKIVFRENFLASFSVVAPLQTAFETVVREFVSVSHKFGLMGSRYDCF